MKTTDVMWNKNLPVENINNALEMEIILIFILLNCKLGIYAER